METCLLQPDNEGLDKAAALLREGEVVAVPTETVYGLAANAFDNSAVEKIFAAKGRPQDNPLIVHIDSLHMLGRVAREVPTAAFALAEAFWPGPLTVVLPRCDGIAPAVSAGLGSVGVRMPAHDATLTVIGKAGVPLAAPSANLSGSPSPTSSKHVMDDLGGRIPAVLEGGTCLVGVESTVLSLLDKPVVLRPGFVTPEEIAAVLDCEVQIASGVNAPPAENSVPESPGMKYRHYAPSARLTLIDADFKAFKEYVDKIEDDKHNIAALCFTGESGFLTIPSVAYGALNDAASQAAGLFDALRKVDSIGCGQVFARVPQKEGVGLAVYNRILRAAGFRVITL